MAIAQVGVPAAPDEPAPVVGSASELPPTVAPMVWDRVEVDACVVAIALRFGVTLGDAAAKLARELVLVVGAVGRELDEIVGETLGGGDGCKVGDAVGLPVGSFGAAVG